MSYRERMNCIVTPKGVLFSDEERLNPDNLPEKAKIGIEKEKERMKCVKTDNEYPIVCRPFGCRSVCAHSRERGPKSD